jgi:hypothetical protein
MNLSAVTDKNDLVTARAKEGVKSAVCKVMQLEAIIWVVTAAGFGAAVWLKEHRILKGGGNAGSHRVGRGGWCGVKTVAADGTIAREEKVAPQLVPLPHLVRESAVDDSQGRIAWRDDARKLGVIGVLG